MKIHKEGYRILVVAYVIMGILAFLSFAFLNRTVAYVLLFIILSLMCFVLRFFRVPKRNCITDSTAVYSPADGTIVAIEEIDETDFLKCRCIQVSVFMSVWNVHINWYPISGVVKAFKYHEGDYLVARHPKSSTHNERTSVVVEREDGVKLLIRQIAGAVARRIVCYAKPENLVKQCSEMGFIKFGSRVDVFLPLNSSIKVEIGQKVIGNITRIAEV